MDTTSKIVLGIIIIAIIVGVVLLLVFAINDDDENPDVMKAKGLYGVCKTNFECNWGFVCELRDHPSDGLCVIAPGGACYNNKDAACYSGYVCDSQDGVCVKSE
jgi:hypothetical protein